jgi:large subunit ribosomal protein L17
MKHRIGYNRLGRNVSHRKALYRSMATALFRYERIKTTKPKAREIRRVAEKLITRARNDNVQDRCQDDTRQSSTRKIVYGNRSAF